MPVQPGNSGGALVDEHGNMVGVVSAQLSQKAALESSGTLAQNVNYAVKSSYVLSFLEAIPAVSSGLLAGPLPKSKFLALRGSACRRPRLTGDQLSLEFSPFSGPQK